MMNLLFTVESEDENSSATIGIGAGIGSTAMVVGLLIVFIYILKRYRYIGELVAKIHVQQNFYSINIVLPISLKRG